MSFDAVLKFIPDYIDQFLRLVGGARRFFAGQELNETKALVRALLFLLNSSILAFVLRVPVFEGETVYWQTGAVTVVFYMATAVALGAVAFGCCRLVGGKAPLPGHITIFAYVAGISTIAFALATLIAGGIIQVNLPDQTTLYGDYMSRLMSGGDGLDKPKFAVLNESRELTFAILTVLAGLLVILAWLIWCWRAYGDLNKLDGRRTAGALILFLVIGYGVSSALALAQSARGITLF